MAEALLEMKPESTFEDNSEIIPEPELKRLIEEAPKSVQAYLNTNYINEGHPVTRDVYRIAMEANKE